MHTSLRQIRSVRTDPDRFGQIRAAAGCYAPLRTTFRRFPHLLARFADATSERSGRTGSSGLLRTTTDHFSAVPPPTCEVCRRDFGKPGRQVRVRASVPSDWRNVSGDARTLSTKSTNVSGDLLTLSTKSTNVSANARYYGPLFAAPPPISRLICLLAGQSHACMQHPHKDA